MTSRLNDDVYTIGREKFDPIDFLRQLVDNKIMTLVVELPSSYLTSDLISLEYPLEQSITELVTIKKMLLSNVHFGYIHHIQLKFNKGDYYDHVYNTINVSNTKTSLKSMQLYETDLITYVESYNILHSIKYKEVCDAKQARLAAQYSKDKVIGDMVDESSTVPRAEVALCEQTLDPQMQSMVDKHVANPRFNNNKVAASIMKNYIRDEELKNSMSTFKRTHCEKEASIQPAVTGNKLVDDADPLDSNDPALVEALSSSSNTRLMSNIVEYDDYINIGSKPISLDDRFNGAVGKYTKSDRNKRNRNRKF